MLFRSDAAALGPCRFQKELPLPTRVHELAKELGLKSQELLDRIVEWGLDVKRNSLASLETSMVERIKQLVRGAGGAAARTEPDAGTTAAPPRPSPPAATHQATSPVTAAPSAPPAPTLTQQAGAAAFAPSARVPASPAPTTGAPARTSEPQSRGPLAAHSRSSSLTSPPRSSGGGPLSGHTPHRGSTAGGGGGTAVRPGGGTSSQADLRPHPATPAPLKRSDYISPAGTRHSTIGRPAPGAAVARRPGSETVPGQASDTPRRDTSSSASRRPLPQVAPQTQAPQTRRAEAQRPSGPESKTQRPEVKLTPEQFIAMKESGQLGTGAHAPPGRSAAAAQAGAAPGASPRGAAAGLRRAPVGPPAQTAIDEEEERKNKTSRLGTPADRANRRAKRTERSHERRVSSPVPVSALIGDADEDSQRVRGPRRSHKGGAHAATAPLRKSRAE